MNSGFTKAEPTVAVVAEYNPFHNGHFYQIEKIKEMFPGAAVVSIMSGSLVQRGDISIFSKYDRAEIAARNGVDAVFELPSVYSCAPANVFASCAVRIMQKLSGVDYICFGSECGDLELLDFAAEKTMGDDFSSKLSEAAKARKNTSYPNNVHDLFRELHGESKASVLLGSNNILAIEYLKAIKKSGAKIAPVTIKRIGAGFNSEEPVKNMASAAYIRRFIRENKDMSPLKKLMPGSAYEFAAGLVGSGKFADIENLAPAIISHLSRLGAADLAEIAEVGGGMEHRIKKALDGCFDYGSLLKKLQAKHASPSAVRRMVSNAFFGITKKMREQPPDFTAVLAIGQKGANFLSRIKKSAKIEIATKPADMKNNGIFDHNCFIDNTCKLALLEKSSEINEIRQKPRLSW